MDLNFYLVNICKVTKKQQLSSEQDVSFPLFSWNIQHLYSILKYNILYGHVTFILKFPCLEESVISDYSFHWVDEFFLSTSFVKLKMKLLIVFVFKWFQTFCWNRGAYLYLVCACVIDLHQILSSEYIYFKICVLLLSFKWLRILDPTSSRPA